MKQSLFMFLALFLGLGGAMLHPFYAVLPYYLFSILQPQFLWDWALPPEVRWSLFAAGLVVLALVLHAPQLPRLLRWNRIASLLVIYTGLLLLSVLLAYDTALAGTWVEIDAKILVLALITTLVIDDLNKVRWVGWLIVLAIGYLAWHFNSLYLFEHRMDIVNVGLGAFDNNGVGYLMAMGLPFAYAYSRNAKSWWLSLFIAGLGLLMLHALLLSFSRGAMLSTLIGGGWLLWNHRPRRQAAVWTAAVVVVVVVMAGPSVRQRFSTIAHADRDSSAQSRFESWAAAWDMIWDHPLTGVGVRNSNLYSNNYGADLKGRTIHNLYLQLAADSGLPTLAAYLTLSLFALGSIYSARRRLLTWARQREAAAPYGGVSGRLAFHQTRGNYALANILMAFETGLIIFYCDSFFFSSEMLELHWLMIAVAGCVPLLVKERLERQERKLRRRRTGRRAQPRITRSQNTTTPVIAQTPTWRRRKAG